MVRTYAFWGIALFANFLQAQEWVSLREDPDVRQDAVRQGFDTHFSVHQAERGKGHRVFNREDHFWSERLYPSGIEPDPGAFTQAWRQERERPAAAGAKAANWQPLGPTAWTTWSYNPGNGRLNVVATAPNDPQVIYAGAPSGGLWRSMDGGLSWESLFQDMPTIGVSGIVIDPTDPQVIHVATGDGNSRATYSIGVVKSTDGGATWTPTGLDWHTHQVRRIRALRMHPTDANVLFAAANNGLWRTVNGGDSWQRVALGAFSDVAFKTDDPQVVFAASDRLHRSTNGGTSFTVITNGLPAANEVRRMCIGTSPDDPEMIYVLCGRMDNGGYRGLYRSTNGGLNFTLRSSSPNLFGYSESGNDSGGQCWYDMALAVDPTNASRVLVGGINVWRSTDGGSTWSIRSHWFWPSSWGYTHADIHELRYTGGTLYCASDGGLFRSDDHGNNWTDLSAGLSITQCYKLGLAQGMAGRMLIGTQDNGTNRWDGSGWVHVLGADGMEAAIDPSDPDVMYCTTQNGTIHRSTDAGASWIPISANGITETGAWVTPYVLDPTNPDRIWAGYKNLWRSDDRGDSWVQVTNSTQNRDIRAIAVAPSDPNVIFFSNDAQLRRSLTGAAPFTTVNNGLPDLAITSIAIHPTDAAHIMVSMSGYNEGQKVFRSLDQGATWTNISGNLPNVPANSVVMAPGGSGVYVGTDLGVYYRDTSLGNWQPFGQGLPHVPITELEFHAGENALYAATYGRGVWRTDAYAAPTTAPIADFRAAPRVVCTGGTVRFVDLSIGAAPGWQWEFPGATPAASTDAEPLVVFPASGSYPVTLTVQNTHGATSHTALLDILVVAESITVQITLDEYPAETSWSLIDDADGRLVARGGPYSGYLPGTTVNSSHCIPNGCYTFTIHDRYGDGLCCGVGNGSYSVSSSSLGLVATGGTFTAEESTAFCVGTSVGIADRTDQPLVHLVEEGVYRVTWPEASPAGGPVLYDAQGRSCTAERTREGAQVDRVDLRSLPSGVYLLHSTQHARCVRLVRP